ncbi:2-dehydropantoate 2-reductase [Amylocarpus encephaloides]|uniref:2-dehydropantoate 2-reductase n=1 Tax=Amylocarpus encephaloides TaxID=45428 RepID=A0A9P8C4Y8_9HELO|nr:2-dehydropantoate 2-reductase [Amylocarpus encephaloides]
MPKILLFGAGGVGSIYAYILMQAGASVTVVCRSNYETVQEHGFTINSAIWGQGIHVRPGVVRTPEEAKDVEWDFVILCSKAMPGSKPSTADIIRPAISPRTAVVLCQNGIHIEDEYASAFPNNAIISTVIYLPVTQIAPGIITHGHLEWIEVGTYPHNAPAAHKAKVVELAELFRAGNGTIHVYEDVQVCRWNKLITNGSWNPICALSLSKDIDFLASSPLSTSMIQSVMLEIVKIAQAAGYMDITEKNAETHLDRVLGRIPDKGVYPSMVADAIHMRPMEIEAIVGNPLKVAREKGVKTPTLDVVYALISALDQANARRRAEGKS